MRTLVGATATALVILLFVPPKAASALLALRISSSGAQRREARVVQWPKAGAAQEAQQKRRGDATAAIGVERVEHGRRRRGGMLQHWRGAARPRRGAAMHGCIAIERDVSTELMNRDTFLWHARLNSYHGYMHSHSYITVYIYVLRTQRSLGGLDVCWHISKPGRAVHLGSHFPEGSVAVAAARRWLVLAQRNTHTHTKMPRCITLEVRGVDESWGAA